MLITTAISLLDGFIKDLASLFTAEILSKDASEKKLISPDMELKSIWAWKCQKEYYFFFHVENV